MSRMLAAALIVIVGAFLLGLGMIVPSNRVGTVLMVAGGFLLCVGVLGVVTVNP